MSETLSFFFFTFFHHCAHSDSLLTLASLRWHPVVPLPSWLEQTRPPSPRETLTPSRPMAAPSICPPKADLHPLERQCITPAPLCLHRYESPGRSVRLGLTCRLTDDFLSSSQPWITGRIGVFRCFHSSGGYYGSVLLIVSCLILRGDASPYWSPCLLRSSESPPEALVTLVGEFVPWTLRERLAFLKTYISRPVESRRLGRKQVSFFFFFSLWNKNMSHVCFSFMFCSIKRKSSRATQEQWR